MSNTGFSKKIKKEITIKIYNPSRSNGIRFRIETNISGKGLLTNDYDHAKEEINKLVDLAIKELNAQQ